MACNHREYNEFRRVLFTNAAMYGKDIYPKSRDFIGDVHSTMSSIVRIEDIQVFLEGLNDLAADCKKHANSAAQLEMLHIFAGVKFTRLEGKLREWSEALRSDAVRNESTSLFRALYSWVNASHEQDIMRATKLERENLNKAATGIEDLHKCCKQMKHLIHEISMVLGRISLSIKDLRELLKKAKPREDAKDDYVKNYWRWTKESAQKLKPGLESFYADSAEFRVTVLVLQDDDENSAKHAELEWRSDLRKFISEYHESETSIPD